MGYVSPFDPEQSTYTVPVGLITPKKIKNVRENIIVSSSGAVEFAIQNGVGVNPTSKLSRDHLQGFHRPYQQSGEREEEEEEEDDLLSDSDDGSFSSSSSSSSEEGDSGDYGHNYARPEGLFKNNFSFTRK